MRNVANPLRVVVELSAGRTLGGLMNEMREWLDSQQIQAVEFRSARSPAVGVEIGFKREEDAQRFREHFRIG
jgi:hypothetical protein